MNIRPDRNSKQELQRDLDFVQEIISTLYTDRHSSKEKLKDWRFELKQLLMDCDNRISLSYAKEGLQLPPEISTSSGQMVNLLAPDPDTIFIEDIAVGLCAEPRWAGQLWMRYTVADHSVRVAEIAPPEHAIAALLHDASEYILKDIPKPLKQLLPNYEVLERRMMEAIAYKFGFEYPLHKSIKAADNIVFEREWDCFRARPNQHHMIFTGEANCGCSPNINVTPVHFLTAFMECQNRQAKARGEAIDQPPSTS